jgi:hypothetical protein
VRDRGILQKDENDKVDNNEGEGHDEMDDLQCEDIEIVDHKKVVGIKKYFIYNYILFAMKKLYVLLALFIGGGFLPMCANAASSDCDQTFYGLMRQ